MLSIVIQRFKDSISVKNKIIHNEVLVEKIEIAAEIIYESLENGGKLIIGGNGGSESDSLHFAGEIVGRFQKEREPWPAIVLGSDQATLTAIANDYGYEEAYARQAKAYAKEEDVFIGISTGGNSMNIVRAIEEVKGTGCKTIALLGRDGGKMAEMADCSIIVPSDITARIQESHITIIHILCELLESKM